MGLSDQVALGLPSLAGYELFEALRVARSLGFHAIMALPGGPRTEHSLGAFPTYEHASATAEHRLAVREALAPFARRSVHQAWDSDWRGWIDCARDLGAETLTVHAGRPHDGEGAARFLVRRGDELRRMQDAAGQLGIRIGVENEGGDCATYLHLLDSLEGGPGGATIDVGHCAYFDDVLAITDLEGRVTRLNDLISDLVAVLGTRLVGIHAHDVRREDWRDHRAIPGGVIDFPRLFQALRRGEFAGLVEIELEEPDRLAAVRQTGEYLSALLRHA